MCATEFGTYGNSIKDLQEFKVEEKSYSPEAEIMKMDKATHAANPNFRHIAACCALNSFAKLKKAKTADGSGYEMTGSSTEGALKCFSAKLAKYDAKYGFEQAPLDYMTAIEQEVGEVALFEFSSERKTMSRAVTNYEGNNKNTVFLKGASDRVLMKCNKISCNGKSQKLTEADKKTIEDQLTAKEKLGLRVLGIAYAPDGGNMKHLTSANASSEAAD
jgi:magnesium-transporting ATPase (P-type)